MNREIKFRIWDKVENKYIFITKREDYDWLAVAVEHPELYDVQQFTGLLDKQSKEIYEGDILKDDVGDILEVKFGKLPLSKSGDCVCSYEAFYCKCYGQLGKSPMYECQKIGDWMEVIGNIYETPELLNTPPTEE